MISRINRFSLFGRQNQTSRRFLNPLLTSQTRLIHTKERVAIIGSGNWGSVAARIVAQNVASGHLAVAGGDSIRVDPSVKVWVFEEQVDVKDDKGAQTKKSLVDVINQTNVNVKYLPGVSLGSNIVATGSLLHAVSDATVLVFVTPHQFVSGVCRQIKGHVRTDARAISLIKGMEVNKHGFQLISEYINTHLDIDCSVLMGANLASEIALEKFSEATVGFTHSRSASFFQALFHRPYFHVSAVQDTEGVEMCGTLKNIVAIGAGLVDGLNMGNNTKSAIIRIGLLEMMKLSRRIFPTTKDATFFESCGVADLITTCYGGRNRKCAEAYAASYPKRTFLDIERDLLNGQKLQGTLTSIEVQHILKHHGWEEDFPLFTTINQIVEGKKHPKEICNLPPPKHA